MAKTKGSRIIDSAKNQEKEAQAKILEDRRRRMADDKIAFMPNEIFAQALKSRKLQAEILAPAPVDEKRARKTKPPSGLPPYMADLYKVPLLTREQEAHLFRKMNYLRYLAANARDRARQPLSIRDLDEIDRLLEEAQSCKNQIISANLRLVVSIAKRHISNATDGFFELVSDGNMSLIRAVEKFNYARGNKFSTYATWTIRKNFTRSIALDRRRATRFTTGVDDIGEGSLFDQQKDPRGSDNSERYERLQKAISKILQWLDDRERIIITGRYDLDGAHKTLAQLGKELGITKERVRQLELRAQSKLSKIAVRKRRGDLPEVLTEAMDD